MTCLIGINGSSGEGKSFTMRSAASDYKLAVATLDPEERAFYVAHPAIKHVDLFMDEKWRPRFDQYEATGFDKLLRWLDKQHKSDSQVVVIDPASAATDLAMHEMLKMVRSDDPKAIGHGGAYTGHDGLWKQLISECKLLVAGGKHVVLIFHVRMRELEGVGSTTKVMTQNRDASGNVIEEEKFDEQLLPALQSSYRQELARHFGLWLYTKPAGYGKNRKFFLTAVPDKVRPAKSKYAFKDGVQPDRIPNNFKTLLESIDEKVMTEEEQK